MSFCCQPCRGDIGLGAILDWNINVQRLVVSAIAGVVLAVLAYVAVAKTLHTVIPVKPGTSLQAPNYFFVIGFVPSEKQFKLISVPSVSTAWLLGRDQSVEDLEKEQSEAWPGTGVETLTPELSFQIPDGQAGLETGDGKSITSCKNQAHAACQWKSRELIGEQPTIHLEVITDRIKKRITFADRESQTRTNGSLGLRFFFHVSRVYLRLLWDSF